LEPQKLLKIIDLAEPLFENADLEVELEYQMEKSKKIQQNNNLLTLAD
jgi:hypothetical protein